MPELDNKREIMVLQNTINILDYDKRMAENKLALLKTKRSDTLVYGNPLPRNHDREIERILSQHFLNVHVEDRHGGSVDRNLVVYRLSHTGFANPDVTYPSSSGYLALRDLGYYISGVNARGIYLSVI